MGNILKSCKYKKLATEALFGAVEQGETTNLKQYIKEGANVNAERCINSIKLTPLELAIKENKVDAVRQLSKLGARTNVRAYALAIDTKNADMLDTIVKRYPKFLNNSFKINDRIDSYNLPTEIRITPLTYAFHKRASISEIKILLDAGASLHKKYDLYTFSSKVDTNADINQRWCAADELSKKGSSSVKNFVENYDKNRRGEFLNKFKSQKQNIEQKKVMF